MFKDILKCIESYNRIIIHRHSRPDGDALGSQLGLKHLILDNFSNKKVYCVGDMTARYSFIGEMDVIPDSFYDDALVFVLDCADPKLISDDRFQKASKLIKIDHHIKCCEYCDLELIDESFESCCGLIGYYAILNNLKLSKESATSLFTGIVTDSGRFRYDQTTSRTFYVVSKLMEYDIDTNYIYDSLYTESFDNILLRAKYVLKIQFSEKNVAYIMTTKEEIKEMNVDVFSISRGMVNTMAGIKGVDIWVNFTEDEDGIIAEVRSGKYNINPVCVKYGGGGHQKASGCGLKSFDECYEMIKDLEKLVQ